MDVDMPAVPTPTVRSAITVPRPGATPAPRTPAATATAPAPRSSTRPPPPSSTPVAEPQRSRCPLCRRPHRLQHCSIFRSMQPMQRQKVAQAHGHCLNCLATVHTTQECTSVTLCQLCNRPHHTMLHRTPKRPVARQLAANRSQQPSRHRWLVAPPSSRARRNEASPRRRQYRTSNRRSTGLSSVVATLQQLQRLLG
ncbi:salivary glue protein Sgs-3-like [Bactrocera neohumeralis]|uniref:salivary glue protein Sgs-3-like n=1 Tax=Bactrocera tryoni TaxID=59916 RepID=UPI001A971A5A|nr:salivary glue protein Sgs-3-like [Bactrocera tryoni]XP_050338232.1 salivary glue protein Sgs-3-like [Bactrocera neohumeralis]